MFSREEMWGVTNSDGVDNLGRRFDTVQNGTVGMRLALDHDGIFHHIETIHPGGSIEESAIVRIGDRLMYIEDFFCGGVPLCELRCRVSGPLGTLVTLSFERTGFDRLIRVTVPRQINRSELDCRMGVDTRGCSSDTSSATTWSTYNQRRGWKRAACRLQHSARGPGSAFRHALSTGTGLAGAPADRRRAKRMRDEDGDAALVSLCASRGCRIPAIGKISGSLGNEEARRWRQMGAGSISRGGQRAIPAPKAC